jgi:hypothetical protein
VESLVHIKITDEDRMPTDGPLPKTPSLDTPRGTGGSPAGGFRKSGYMGVADITPRGIPEGTIEPERFRLILHRLATGFYDRAEVRERILAGVGSDL